MRLLITGAARSIGAATATARNVDLLTDLDVAIRLTLDVTDESSIRPALDGAGEIDGIVNNAAVTGKGPLESYPLDQLRLMFETN